MAVGTGGGTPGRRTDGTADPGAVERRVFVHATPREVWATLHDPALTTVLFPELRGLVGAKAYAELGEQFEDRERAMLGERGFEHAVEDVARLERAFGLDDLAKLTPT